ncbi:MAG: terpene cyclase/mutase family protein [Planctomycetes bacterium]|nr:terpene cyclase/mutase family protein [Planctomycetota bacterium]
MTAAVDSLRQQLAARLLAARRDDGSWGYAPSQSGASEPTAWAALALSTVGEPDAAAGAAEWLARRRQQDGSVSVTTSLSRPAWTTSLAVLVWSQAGEVYRTSLDRGVSWLCKATGEVADVRLSEAQHDAGIPGWSWVEHTHSWVEPTAYAVMALRAAGRLEHSRTRDGLRLLADRALPSGGWNYGNTQVLEHTLRAFPETTGVALTALARLGSQDFVERAARFLETELPRIRTPLALGWGLIGLHAWGRRPADAGAWIAEAAEAAMARPVNPLHDALLLLAAADKSPVPQWLRRGEGTAAP